MIFHIYKGDASISSRLHFQKTIPTIKKHKIVDNLKYLDFKLFKYSGDNSVFIFHQHAMLLNLIMVYFFCMVKMIKVRIVFDVHDLNEIKYNKTVKSYVFFSMIFALEFIVFKLPGVRFITVSKGLSRLLWLKYNKKVPVVYNMSDDIDLLSCCKYNNQKRIVYFGQINQNRLPLDLLVELLSGGYSVDIYGYFSGCTSSYEFEFERLKNECKLMFKGRYSPDNIGDLIRVYDFSLIYFDDDRLNIKFCMPNKLLQSLSLGVPVIISEGLFEIYNTLSLSGFIYSFDDLTLNKGMSKCIDYNCLEAKLNKMKNVSIKNFTSCIGEV
ncbi:glycosyltransferase family protein [Vibrio algicola]|uniref:Glycosyltransferase n=1 Tax=Vibrio algicola TaxID=2662262 RepID=A0A5Q0TAN4_9VIBR|nr:glycosyltransferase [Vibrio algicola]